MPFEEGTLGLLFIGRVGTATEEGLSPGNKGMSLYPTSVPASSNFN